MILLCGNISQNLFTPELAQPRARKCQELKLFVEPQTCCFCPYMSAELRGRLKAVCLSAVGRNSVHYLYSYLRASQRSVASNCMSLHLIDGFVSQGFHPPQWKRICLPLVAFFSLFLNVLFFFYQLSQDYAVELCFYTRKAGFVPAWQLLGHML